MIRIRKNFSSLRFAPLSNEFAIAHEELILSGACFARIWSSHTLTSLFLVCLSVVCLSISLCLNRFVERIRYAQLWFVGRFAPWV